MPQSLPDLLLKRSNVFQLHITKTTTVHSNDNQLRSGGSSSGYRIAPYNPAFRYLLARTGRYMLDTQSSRRFIPSHSITLFGQRFHHSLIAWNHSLRPFFSIPDLIRRAFLLQNKRTTRSPKAGPLIYWTNLAHNYTTWGKMKDGREEGIKCPVPPLESYFTRAQHSLTIAVAA